MRYVLHNHFFHYWGLNVWKNEKEKTPIIIKKKRSFADNLKGTLYRIIKREIP